MTGATERKTDPINIESDGHYSLTNLRPGEHQFYAQSWFNSYDDYFEHPYNYNVLVDVPCEGVNRNVSSNAAFVNGKITFDKDATVVGFKDDQEGVDPPMASVNWAKIYGHGISATEPDTHTGINKNRFSLGRDNVSPDNGRYDLILADGKWNVYYTELNFRHDNIDLCGRGKDRYLNSTLAISDFTRTSRFTNEIRLASGETLNNNDFTYETGSVTLKYYVNDGGTGTLKNPYLTATSYVKDDDGNTKTSAKAKASSAQMKKPGEGEVTVIGISRQMGCAAQSHSERDIRNLRRTGDLYHRRRVQGV